MKLTPKQQAFADYYIQIGNATEAARKAGYSDKTAKEVGYENLTKPHIKAYIDERMAVKDAERIASQDEVLEFLTNVMRGKVTEKVPLGLGMGEQMLVKNELQGKDRIKAAELIGKRYGLWVEKVNLDGDLAVTIIDDIGVDDEEG
ncbi:terminase small subunit [Brevibacillus phage Abouo]|uniref:Terminase small subunit n=2 Tax=Abouovirus TaxID=1984773 RepID=S5MP31_9CAUD|nr:terminase small subunit [Brevibacillus phage Davies]YP_009220058.1 terminase small subunit [Brevibacillus phage Abouo]AGR47448.1 terminase small subunit [Brevibacillus phage Abouo]AGR47540.1 terminase small subunit [Brevibacillus phage Davies]